MGRPKGSVNKRTQEILDLIKNRGDTDPLDALSNLITTNKDPSIIAQASSMLAPYVHSRRGTLPASRYVEDAISVPEFISIQEAQNFLADIARRSGAGELELQCATDISNLVKNWILSITAQDEFQLKLAASNATGDQTIRIEGGMPSLPGTSVIMAKEPSLNGSTNGNVIDHVDTPAIESVPSEGQEPEPHA
jgi:hypothetical protein